MKLPMTSKMKQVALSVYELFLKSEETEITFVGEDVGTNVRPQLKILVADGLLTSQLIGPEKNQVLWATYQRPQTGYWRKRAAFKNRMYVYTMTKDQFLKLEQLLSVEINK